MSVPANFFTNSSLVNLITKGIMGSVDMTEFNRIAFILVAIYVAGGVASYLQQYIMASVTQYISRHIRSDINLKVNRIPLNYFDTTTRGDILSVVTNDVDTMRQMVSQALPQFVNSAFTIVSVFISMIYLSVPLTILTICMVGVTGFVAKKAASASGKYFGEQQRNLGKANGYIEEMIGGMKVVKVFCHEDAVIREFDEANDRLIGFWLYKEWKDQWDTAARDVGALAKALTGAFGEARTVIVT